MMFKSRFPRELLNEIKWTSSSHDLSKCKIYYINRGSPDDTAVVEGSQIIKIDRGFLILEGIPYERYIPYHRIFKIEYEDKVIFDKSKGGNMAEVKEIKFRNEDDILRYAKSIGMEDPHIDNETSYLMTGWFNVYGDGMKLHGHWKETTDDGFIFGVYPPVGVKKSG